MHEMNTLMKLNNSIKIYVVGGYVRDRLLGRDPKDHDFVVVGATPEMMTSAGFNRVGADFPVFLNSIGDEYALARTERKTSAGYNGFETDFNPSITLADDLVRRDLTINAMAREVMGWSENGFAILNDTVIDLHNGQKDLNDGILRHVSEAFAEDPVRVLRTARFAARLDFKIADETVALMTKLVDQGELDHLVPERVWTEFERAMSEYNPSEFFWALRQCRAIEVLFPEMGNVISIIWPLAKAAVYKLDTNERIIVALSGMSIDDAATLLDRLKAPSDIKRLARKLRMVMDATAEELTAESVFALCKNIDAYGNNMNDLGSLTQAIRVMVRTNHETWDKILYSIYSTQNTSFTSLTAEQQTNLKGKEIGKAIDELRTQQINDIIWNP